MARAFGEKTIALVDPETSLIQQYILEFPGFALCECPSPIIALQNPGHLLGRHLGSARRAESVMSIQVPLILSPGPAGAAV